MNDRLNAVPCLAVPCLAVPCRAVSFCSAPCHVPLAMCHVPRARHPLLQALAHFQQRRNSRVDDGAGSELNSERGGRKMSGEKSLGNETKIGR
jgi:hypothetical protein